MTMMERQALGDRLVEYAAFIGKVVEALPKKYTGRKLAEQLFRSGTSIGANYEEAQGAESTADFVHKLQISLKEARESYFWLRVIEATKMLPPKELEFILDETRQLRAILSKAVATAKGTSKSRAALTLAVFLIFDICLLISIFGSSADAVSISSNAGTATAQFLKLEMGARHAAMGGTYAGYGSDVFTLWGQPAALVTSPDAWQVGFQHTEWFQGVTQEYLGATRGINERSRVGVVVNTVGVDGLARTTEDNLGQLAGTGGTFGARDWAVALHYGWMVNEDIGVGVAGRWIRSTIDDVTANGFAADAGIRWRVRSVEGLTLGASVTNAGTGLRYVRTTDNLPLAVRLGGAMRLRGLNVLIAADVVKSLDRDIDGGVGVEWRPVEVLKLRAGYRSQGRDAGEGLTAGIGFDLAGLELDYAYVPFGPLGDAHRVSANYVFGGGRMSPTTEAAVVAQPTDAVRSPIAVVVRPAVAVRPEGRYVPPTPMPRHE